MKDVGTRLHLAGWNLRSSGGARHAHLPLPRPRVELVQRALESPAAIVGLQEVTPGFAGSLPGIVHSLERRRPGRFDGGNRMLGVGLLVTPGIEIKRWGLIERAPFPERTLSAELTVGGRELHVVVFHALAGVTYKHAKSAQFIAIAEHLVELGGDVVLIGDANEPMIDSRTLDDMVFWDGNGKGAEYLFGSSPVHPLKDAWRAYLGDAVREKPVRGPLAVSYRSQKNARRYDHIHVPQYWRVLDMAYDYDGAIEAGSDHALVTATVEVERDRDRVRR